MMGQKQQQQEQARDIQEPRRESARQGKLPASSARGADKLSRGVSLYELSAGELIEMAAALGNSAMQALIREDAGVETTEPYGFISGSAARPEASGCDGAANEIDPTAPELTDFHNFEPVLGVRTPFPVDTMLDRAAEATSVNLFAAGMGSVL